MKFYGGIVMKKYIVLINEYTRAKRIYETVNIDNDLDKHDLETNHKLNFKDSKMLVYIHNKKGQKIVESSIILNYDTVKRRPFFKKLVSIIWLDWCWRVTKSFQDNSASSIIYTQKIDK